MEGEVAIAFVRSQVAHGVIRSVDVSAAKEATGVLAVFTGEDAVADKLTGFTPIPDGIVRPQGIRITP